VVTGAGRLAEQKDDPVEQNGAKESGILGKPLGTDHGGEIRNKLRR
jgi:hypothetical protein